MQTLIGLTQAAYQTPLKFIVTQKAVKLVVRITLTMEGKVGQRIVDLAADQILTISQTSNRLFIGNEHCQRLSDFLRLRKSYN